MHLHHGTTQLIDADGDTRLAIDGNELSFETGKRSFDDTYLHARPERQGIEMNGAFGVVDHKAKFLHLHVRDRAGRVLATQHHVTQYRRQVDDRMLLRWIYMYKDHHWD